MSYLCIYLLLDPLQYEFIDEELTFEQAESRCNDINARLVEPMEIEKNNELVNLASQRIGEKGFWIGIKDNKYVSNNQPILWSNKKDKNAGQSCNDKITFCIKCDDDWQGNVPSTNDIEFGMWSGLCATMKKFAAGCDKKIGKIF